jgi:hypothetical protein
LQYHLSMYIQFWEQYSKILYNMHFNHVIWHHNAFCNIFATESSFNWKLCYTNLVIEPSQDNYIDCLAFSVKFSNCQFGFHILEYYLAVTVHLNILCKNKCANAKVPTWRFLMKISSFTAVEFRLCNIPQLSYSLIC